MSLGKPGHSPVVMRRAAVRLGDGSTMKRSSSHEHLRPIFLSGAPTTSRSVQRAPVTSMPPPVIAATTPQLPASM